MNGDEGRSPTDLGLVPKAATHKKVTPAIFHSAMHGPKKA